MKKITLYAGLASCCFGLLHAGAQTNDTRPPDHVKKDIAFQTHDGLPMFGRLILPKSNAPRAIVIYVQTAEGATIDQKRSLGDGETFNYYDVYREKLPPMGIGFFSYEGRGIRMGEDPPRYEKIDWEIFNTSTLENKVRDVLSAVEAVRGQDGLQRTPVLLLGCSEGTLLAAEAASRKPDAVAGLVLYAVEAVNLKPTLTYLFSEGPFLRFRPVDEDKDGVVTKAEWDKVVKNQDFTKADFNGDGKLTVEDIKVVMKKNLDAIAADNYEALQETLKAGAASLPKDWVKDQFTHAEIWTFLSQLNIPIGCFHGDADANAPIAAVKDLEAKAKKASLTKMEFHYFEGLDHSLSIVPYFINGRLPKGHQAIFEFIDRVAPKPAGN